MPETSQADGKLAVGDLYRYLGHYCGDSLKTGPLDDDHNKGLRTRPSLLLLPLGALKEDLQPPQVGAGDLQERLKPPKRTAS